MTTPEIAAIRKEYVKATLDEANVADNPIHQFSEWFNQSIHGGVIEPSAMVLTSVSSTGQPSSRIVLLKGVDHGFLFFTNYESRKGQELTANPNTALLFFWPELERQIRIHGVAERLTTEESLEYFHSRPRDSQLGAWSSHQSTVIPSREVLDEAYNKHSALFAGRDVPLPPFWGGYRIVPDEIEFWQGRASRMHDRIVYKRTDNGSWTKERLSP